MRFLSKKHILNTEWIVNNCIGIFLVLFYLTEGYSKLHELLTGLYSPLPQYVKLGVLIALAGFLVKKNTGFLVKVGILVFIFFLGQAALSCGFNGKTITALGKYIYPLLLFKTFSIYLLSTKSKESLFNIFEWLLVFNSALIFIGFILGVEAFKTYDGLRFGYNGLFLTSSTGSYVYLVGLFYFLLKRKLDFKTIFITASSLLIGTKAVYLTLLIISVYLIFILVRRKFRYWLLGIVLFLGILFAYIFLYRYGIFREIIQEKGLLSALLSFRNDLFMEDVLPFIQENWKGVHYFIGGLCDIRSRSEMGFIDIVYLFGFLGGAFYLYLYYKSYFTFKFNLSTKVFVTTMIVLVALAGNFFYYATIPIYLLIYRERLLYEEV